MRPKLEVLLLLFNYSDNLILLNEGTALLIYISIDLVAIQNKYL